MWGRTSVLPSSRRAEARATRCTCGGPTPAPGSDGDEVPNLHRHAVALDAGAGRDAYEACERARSHVRAEAERVDGRLVPEQQVVERRVRAAVPALALGRQVRD